MASRAARDSGKTGMKAGGRSDHWIQGAIKRPGQLHRDLGVPQGQKIPASKLQAAEHSSNPKVRQRAHFAENMKGMRHAEGGPMRKAKGGAAHSDAAQDKALFMKMFKTEEAKEGPEGKACGGPMKKAKGGKIKKPRMPKMPMQAPMGPPPAPAMAGPPPGNMPAPTSPQPYRHGGKAQKFAAGGVAKIRHEQSTPAGKQKPARIPHSNLI